jgi:pyruvate dehydrogenase E1 component beta subunit
MLSEEIEMEVIDPRTLVPLDIETIAGSLKKTGRLLVLHEAPERCGFGAEIVRQVSEQAFDYLDAPPKVLGGLNVPIPFSPVLEDACVPSAEDVADAVKKIIPR